MANGLPLTVPAAALDRNGQPSWKPNWPLKVVSLDPSVTGKMKPGGVVRLSIVPAVAPAAAAAEPYGWDLQLRNTKTTKYGADMTYKAFAAWAAQKHRTVSIEDTSTATPTTYKGVPLKTLVGYFDDKNKKTFNKALAAKGYNVVILGMDGFAATIPERRHRGLGAKVILADLANGAAAHRPGRRARQERPAQLEAQLAAQGRQPRPQRDRQDASRAASCASASCRRWRRRRQRRPFDRTRAASRDGWTLTLQGKLKKVLPIGKVPATVAWHGEKAGNINPSLRYVYKGQTLYKLVGLVDDRTRGSFNVALAKKGLH